MNSSKSLFGVSALLLVCASFLIASRIQSPEPHIIKTAYANEAFIMSVLPETKQVESNLRAYEKQLKTRLESKMNEFQTKSQGFQQNYDQMSDLEKADTQEELSSLQESLIKFQRDAETSIQEKQEKLLLPVLEKIQNAIDEIAAAGSYTYIFKADALLYAKNNEDISLTILKRLGIDTSKITPPSGKK